MLCPLYCEFERTSVPQLGIRIIVDIWFPLLRYRDRANGSHNQFIRITIWELARFRRLRLLMLVDLQMLAGLLLQGLLGVRGWHDGVQEIGMWSLEVKQRGLNESMRKPDRDTLREKHLPFHMVHVTLQWCHSYNVRFMSDFDILARKYYHGNQEFYRILHVKAWVGHRVMQGCCLIRALVVDSASNEIIRKTNTFLFGPSHWSPLLSIHKHWKDFGIATWQYLCHTLSWEGAASKFAPYSMQLRE